MRWAAAEAGLPQEVAGAVQEVLAAQGTPFQGEIRLHRLPPAVPAPFRRQDACLHGVLSVAQQHLTSSLGAVACSYCKRMGRGGGGGGKHPAQPGTCVMLHGRHWDGECIVGWHSCSYVGAPAGLLVVWRALLLLKQLLEHSDPCAAPPPRPHPPNPLTQTHHSSCRYREDLWRVLCDAGCLQGCADGCTHGWQLHRGRAHEHGGGRRQLQPRHLRGGPAGGSAW